MKKCPFCPCEFASDEDYNKHMDTFGWDREEHIRKFRLVHMQTEWRSSD